MFISDWLHHNMFYFKGVSGQGRKVNKLFMGYDKVRMYEEIMTNDDNLLTSSLLKMCCLVQAELCVYCPVAGDELTVSVLHDLTLQVNLSMGR